MSSDQEDASNAEVALSPRAKAAALRDERLRKQLRANLNRRKAQKRGRKEVPNQDDEPSKD